MVDGGYNVTRQASIEGMFLFGNEVLFSAPASFFFKVGSRAYYKFYADLPNDIRVGLIIDYKYGDIYEKMLIDLMNFACQSRVS